MASSTSPARPGAHAARPGAGAGRHRAGSALRARVHRFVHRTHGPVLFSRVLWTATSGPLVLGVFVGSLLCFAPGSVGSLDLVPPGAAATPGSGPAAGRAGTAEDLVAQLVRQHRCWSGPAPAEAGDPTSVVVTLPGAARPTYRGSRVTQLALRQLFAGEDHDLLVHAFCP